MGLAPVSPRHPLAALATETPITLSLSKGDEAAAITVRRYRIAPRPDAPLPPSAASLAPWRETTMGIAALILLAATLPFVAAMLP